MTIIIHKSEASKLAYEVNKLNVKEVHEFVDYLKNLDSLDETIEDKAIGELWLLNNSFSNDKLKYYCLHYSNINHYLEKYPSITYNIE